ncbi:response regulator [Azospirillum doebereinerae]
MRILLVEDEVLIALEQRLYLEAVGHEVIGPATTPTEAMELAAGIPPDLALVDVHLARHTSGIDAAEALAKRGVACLFVTSFGEELQRGGGARHAGVGCLAKPFSENALLAAVDVAQAILAGEPPRNVPQTMELF